MDTRKNSLKALLHKSGLLFLMLGGVSAAYAQSSQKQDAQPLQVSLQQAVDYGIKNNANALNADLDVKAAHQKVVQVRGIGLPQVNGSLEFDDYVKRPTQLLPGDFFGMPGTLIPIQFGTHYVASLGASASQLIFDGSYLVGLKASSTFVELASKNAKATKIQTASTITKAYYMVLVSQKSLNAIDANLSRLQKSYNDVKAMYQNGFVEKLDVDRLEVALNNLKVQRSSMENMVKVSRDMLKLQMGAPADADIQLTDSLAENNLPKPEEVKPDPSKRIELSILQTSRVLNELDMKRWKAGYLPSLAAFATYSAQAQRNEFDFFDFSQKWFPTAIVGAKLTVPIFDGFVKQGHIAEAKINIQKIENSIATTQRAFEAQIDMAALSYENNYKNLQIQHSNMDLAQEVVRVAQIKYEQGVGSNLEVVNAEAGLKEAQTNYYSALYNLLVSQVDLMLANGTLY